MTKVTRSIIFYSLCVITASDYFTKVSVADKTTITFNLLQQFHYASAQETVLKESTNMQKFQQEFAIWRTYRRRRTGVPPKVYTYNYYMYYSPGAITMGEG